MFAKKKITIAAIIIAVIVLSGSLQAQEADTIWINYQGKLTDSNGDPLPAGTYTVDFRFYEDSTSAEPLWEQSMDIQINEGSEGLINGLIHYEMNSYMSGNIGIDLFQELDPPWLGVWIEGEEILPRTRITSAPQAFISRRMYGDIKTGPGILELYPPDPCVPPDPCEPAMEMVAEPDNHIIRVHPTDPCVPPEPCIPALELIANAEVHSLKVFPPDPVSSAPDVVILAGADGAKMGIGTDTPTEALEIANDGQIVASVSNAGVFTGNGSGLTEVDALLLVGFPGNEYVHLADLTQQVLGYDPADPYPNFWQDDPDAIPISVTGAAGQISNLQEWKDNSGQVLASVGPSGAAKVDGIKIPTGASDGHVLTSDDDGNGTWQAASSGSSKAMCGDMYEGMTNAGSQVTITFPVTFTAAPYFIVTGLIKSGTYAGKMAHIPKPTPGTSNVTVTIQYWDGGAFDNVGSSVEVMLSYTAMEK